MIPLEDNFNDVLGKAQRGLKLSDQELANTAGVSLADLNGAKEGKFDEKLVRKVAPALRLRADALVTLGEQAWYPKDPGTIDGMAAFNTPYGDMSVNSYFVWDPKTRNGVCFDTGADSAGMLKFAADRKIRVQMVLLTHTHADHIADLGRLKQATEAVAFVCKSEALDGTETFEAGHKFTVGNLQIETRQTSGHSRGGITYVIHGLPRRMAVVGDAIFAGSMGGGGVSYADALRTNSEQIFTLPDDTVLCPGHGPLTSVAEEKLNNPFFPQFGA
jgi:hydroxyacylglutathione hydrolase